MGVLIEPKIKDIIITTDYLQLQQLLKIIGIISTGGEAKIYLANNPVKVNGEDENRRGRKLYPNDIIEVEGNKYRISK